MSSNLSAPDGQSELSPNADRPSIRHSRRLPPSEAAAYIGMSHSYLAHDRLRPRPVVPFIKIGAAIRYDTADLDRFLARCKRESEAAHV